MKATNFRMALWSGELTMALCTIGLGILLVAAPGTALHLVCMIFGIFFLVIGLVKLLAAFSGDMDRVGGLGSILTILAGLFLLFRADAAIGLTSTVVGLIVLATGITKYSSVKELRAYGLHTGTGVASGILTIAAGVLILFRPIGTASFLTVALGWVIILVGLANGATVLALHKAKKQSSARNSQRSNIIEGEFHDI